MARHNCSYEPCQTPTSKRCWECDEWFCVMHLKASSRPRWLVCSRCMKGHLQAPWVWRANINTNSSVDAYEFAVRRRVFGIGWQVGVGRTGMSWPKYENAARKDHKGQIQKWESHLTFIRHAVWKGDYIWIRNREALFYLGVVKGSWKYVSDNESKRADLVNVRRCDWKGPFSPTSVPGQIHELRGLRRAFTDPKSYEPLLRYSERLYHGSAKSGRAEISGALFDWLSPSVCEDLVGIYLQSEKGFSVIPTTCKQSSKKFEFGLIHRATGIEAAVQVKKDRPALSTCRRLSRRPF